MENSIVDYLTPVSLGTVVASFFGILFSSVVRRKSVDLAHLLTRAISAGGIPVSLSLLYCVFDPLLLQRMEGNRLYIAVAALSVFVISGAGAGFIKLKR